MKQPVVSSTGEPRKGEGFGPPLLHLDDAVEAACDQDRDYFERQPQVSCYIRPIVPGEFGPFANLDPREYPLVRVTALAPGVRARSLFAPL